jgi:hypothetical protein
MTHECGSNPLLGAVGVHAIAHLGHALCLGTVCATVETVGCLYTVADDRAATMGAGRRQGVDCTLETVEHMRSASHDDLERLVILITTDFALCHSAGSIHH